MKWLWAALGVVVLVVVWTLIKPVQQGKDGVPLEPQGRVEKPLDIPAWDAPQKALPPNREPIPQSSATDPGQDDRVINIGEPMDPDDPSTWPQPENTEVINIGEPMDPDDPSTWPQPENNEVINIGEPMDPDDPSTWPQSENTEVINIGEPMDPDDPSTWPQPENTEVINIGEPMDPDDPSTWDR